MNVWNLRSLLAAGIRNDSKDNGLVVVRCGPDTYGALLIDFCVSKTVSAT